MHVTRARDDRVLALAEEVVRFATDIFQNDAPVGELRVAVPGEGTNDLPIVIVGVEEVGYLWFGSTHGSLLSPCRGGAVPRRVTGALPVDEGRHAVDDDPVVANRLLDQPPFPGRVVPDPSCAVLSTVSGS